MSIASATHSEAAFSPMLTQTNSVREADTVNLAQFFDLKQNESDSKAETKNSDKLSTFDYVQFDFVESSYNSQGNYQNYVYRVMQSLSPFRKLDYKAHIQALTVTLPETTKKTLILDLDETLIHADFDNKFTKHDHVVSFMYEDAEVTVPIFIRPGLNDFLQSVCELYEIFVFTASKKQYAEAVLNFLDPDNKYFKFRFYRENCIAIKNKIYIKDLRIFANRKHENMVILDNSMYSFTNQLSNGVLINSFYHDKSDKELANVQAYLVNYLHKVPDVRTVNDKIFNFSTIIEQFTQKKQSREI